MNSRLPKPFQSDTLLVHKNTTSWLSSIAAEVTLLRYAVRTSSETSLAFQQENSSPWSCSFWIIPCKNPVQECGKITFDQDSTKKSKNTKGQRFPKPVHITYTHMIFPYFSNWLMKPLLGMIKPSGVCTWCQIKPKHLASLRRLALRPNTGDTQTSVPQQKRNHRATHWHIVEIFKNHIYITLLLSRR